MPLTCPRCQGTGVDPIRTPALHCRLCAGIGTVSSFRRVMTKGYTNVNARLIAEDLAAAANSRYVTEVHLTSVIDGAAFDEVLRERAFKSRTLADVWGEHTANLHRIAKVIQGETDPHFLDAVYHMVRTIPAAFNV